jgi:tetrahydromethanopterin S-methyltransferase subunit B
MATTNGDWNEMKRLVLARMDEYQHKLDDLDDKVAEINTRLAIMSDREDREAVMAKSTSIKVAGVIGTVVSALVAGLFSAFGFGAGE